MNSKKQDLARLAVGDRVKVRLNDGTKVTGVLRSVTDDEPAMLSVFLPQGRVVVRGRKGVRGPGVKSVKLVRSATPPLKTPMTIPAWGKSARDVLNSCGVTFDGPRDPACEHAHTLGGQVFVMDEAGGEVLTSGDIRRCTDCGKILNDPLTLPATDQPTLPDFFDLSVEVDYLLFPPISTFGRWDVIAERDLANGRQGRQPHHVTIARCRDGWHPIKMLCTCMPSGDVAFQFSTRKNAVAEVDFHARQIANENASAPPVAAW